MNAGLRLRLVLDVAAAAALLVCLAYYWLDNTAHEWIGTGMFGLLLAHGMFHRRWFGAVAKKQRDRAGLFNLALTLLLLITMGVLLVSSLLISRTVFGFMSLADGVTARQVHMLAAHWVVLLVAVHIGLRWTIVMGALRKGLGLAAASRTRTVALRVLALGIALHGVQASFEMLVGSKLLLLPVMDMWDFNASAPRFFVNQLSIVGLYAGLTHYGNQWMQHLGRDDNVVRRTTPSAT
jgi:hypothetical protein